MNAARDRRGSWPKLDRYPLRVKRWKFGLADLDARLARFAPFCGKSLRRRCPGNDFDPNDVANLRPFPCSSV